VNVHQSALPRPAAAPKNTSAAPPCTVFLMGETGSGKSTLVNGLVNYFAGSSMRGVDSIKIAIRTQHMPRSEARRTPLASLWPPHFPRCPP
jgi:predicted GTPase